MLIYNKNKIDFEISTNIWLQSIRKLPDTYNRNWYT